MTNKTIKAKDDGLAQVEESLDKRIARRAYEISKSDEAESDEANWLRAEQELQSVEQSG